jgi:LysR family nitrogen assimilation transcriptional regulator
LILPSPGHGLRDFLDEKAGADGVRLAPVFEIDAFGAIKSLVEKGLGLSVLPAHAIAREVAEKGWRAWEFDPPLVRAIHLVLPTDRPLTQAAKAMESLCRTTLGDLVRSGVWSSARMRVVVSP